MNDPDATSDAAALDPHDPRVLAFLPLHKRAFGVAVGTTCGMLVFLLTAVHLVLRPSPAPDISLLGQFFAGYRVSWTGALIGGAWGFFVGFVAGWFVAFSRNLVIAASVFVGRAKQEARVLRDFLDHI